MFVYLTNPREDIVSFSGSWYWPNYHNKGYCHVHDSVLFYTAKVKPKIAPVQYIKPQANNYSKPLSEM